MKKKMSKRIWTLLVLSIGFFLSTWKLEVSATTHYVTDISDFETTLSKVQDGDTINISNGGKGAEIGTQPGNELKPFIIDKSVTITGGDLYVRRAGIILERDVTFKDVNLHMVQGVYDAIFANGHTLILENVHSGQWKADIFAGNIHTTESGGQPYSSATGSHGRVIIRGSNSGFGNIYAGSMQGTLNIPVTIRLESNLNGNQTMIYSKGALQGYYDQNNFLEPEEPTPPAANDNFPVNQPVNIELLINSGVTVDGSTGVGNALVSYTETARGYTSVPSLQNIGGLTLAPSESGTKANVQLAAGSSLVQGAQIMVPSNTKLDLTQLDEYGSFDWDSFTGGGILIMGANQSVSISGTVSGETKLAVGGTNYDDSQSTRPISTNHSYVVASKESVPDTAFTLLPYFNEVFTRKEDGGWYVPGKTTTIPTRVTSIQVTDKAKRVDSGSVEAKIYFTAEYTGSADFPLISDVSPTLTVNNRAILETSPGSGEYVSADLGLSMFFSDDGTEFLYIYSTDSSAIPDGTYTIKWTIPGKNTGNGLELTAQAVLTVGNGDAEPTLPDTSKTISDIHTTLNGVQAPAALASYQSTVPAGTGYKAAISWTPRGTEYDFNTAYTATLELTADTNYQFAEPLTVSDWQVEKTDAGVRLTRTFPKTRLQKITSVTAPKNITLKNSKQNANEVIAELPKTINVDLEAGLTGTTTTTSLDLEWTNSFYDTSAGRVNTFNWSISEDQTKERYDISDVTVKGSIQVTNPAAASVTITGQDTTLTYTMEAIDLTKLFTIDRNAGTVTYSVTPLTGKGTLTGSSLKVTRVGEFTIKAAVAATDTALAGSASITLTVEKAGLTAEGTGRASGTYGDKPGNLTVTGLTAKLDNTVVAGSWLLDDNTLPPVGNGQHYTATFKAAEGAENYQPLTAPVSLSISKAQLSARPGQLRITNGRAESYSYDLNQLLPDLSAGLTYGKLHFSLEKIDLGDYYTSGGKVENTSLILPINSVNRNSEQAIGTIAVGISSDNYQFTPATITVNSFNREIPKGSPTLSKTELVYPALLSEITLTGSMRNKSGMEVEGRFSWNTPSMCYSAGIHQAEWIFTPTDQNTYSSVGGSSTITIKKAPGQGSVTIVDWMEGMTASDPVAVSNTNPVDTVVFSYKVRNDDDSTYSSVKPSQAGFYTVRAIFSESENYTEVIATADFTIKPVSSSVPGGLWIREIADQTYTGKPIKPEIEVYYKEQLLTDKDYRVSYKNNIQAAAADEVNKSGKSIAPAIVIKGRGNYTGTVTKTFTIKPIDLSTYQTNSALREILKISPVYAKKTGKEIKGIPDVKLNGKTISVKANQYTLEYPDTAPGAYVEPGTYEIIIRGTGKNFTGSTTIPQTISEKLISRASITLDKASYPYNKVTGKTCPETVIVKEGRNLLEENVHYSVSYINEDRIGTATVVITGKGEYSGVKAKNYKITGTKLTTSMVTQLEGFIYTGKEHTVVKGTHYTIMDDGITLEEGRDYEISYSGDRTNAGKFKVVFKGINQYSGSVTKTYTITKAEVASLTITLIDKKAPFAKNGAMPKPEVRFGDILLKEGKDYRITYINNRKVASETDNAAPSFYLTGKGNFRGNTTESPIKFSIVPSSLETQVSIRAEDIFYKNRKNNYVSKLILTDKDSGKRLAKKTDYLADFTYEIWDKSTGSYKLFTENRVDEPAERIRMRVTVSGAGNYTGTIQTEYEIYPRSITSVKIGRISAQEYTGEEITPTPEITIRIKEGGRYKDVPLGEENYEIKYENNVNKGKATVYIYGKGQYGGVKKAHFKIVSQKLRWWDEYISVKK